MEEKSFGSRETLRREGWGIIEEWEGKRWTAGEEILGRYVVEGELGQGGMGVVYACRDKVGGVRVAVKALPPELSHNSVEMEEVRENFELVVGLRHPNIAGVRTLEKDGRGEYFLVMDVAEGVSLRKWLREKCRETKDGRRGIPLEEAVEVLRQVAAALDYAHGERVVHRDVKPGNVMIDGRGRAKVLDFGLAAQIRTSLSRASQAYRGTSGTGPYMAPEQWKAQPQDAKTDQYALAVMAYEMLAGRLPFENAALAVLKDAVLHGEAPAIPGLSKGSMTALRRGLAKRGEKRFESCVDFVEALERGTTKRGKHRFPGREKSGKEKRKRGWWGWVAALLLVVGLGMGAWWRQEQVSRQRQLVKLQRMADQSAWQAHLERQRADEVLRKTEEKRLAAEKAAEEKTRLAVQKAEEKDRLEAERARAQREAQEAQRRAVEAERRAQEAELARKEAEEEMAQRLREWEKRLAKLEHESKSPIPIASFGTDLTVPTTDGSKAGETKTIVLPGGVSMEMVWCPPGSFMMGGAKWEKDQEWFPAETQHMVTLTKGFWMAKTEVTQAQWKSVMGTTIRGQRDKANKNWPLRGEGDEYPIYYVNWNECVDFCKKTGLRLPTEAEWEYACRAGSTGAYGGTGNLDDMGWHGGNSGNAVHPVGRKRANAFGLFDMHGNLWEWCSDWFQQDLGSGAATNPTGAVIGINRVLRGGAYVAPGRRCRSAIRGLNDPLLRFDDHGFRPCLSSGVP
jgi:formylglycine-generating enzyme required for sulfatase activity